MISGSGDPRGFSSFCLLPWGLALLFSFVILYWPCWAWAGSDNEIVVDSVEEKIDLRSHAVVLMDDGYTIEQVASPEFADSFSPAGNTFSPGLSPSGYWLRFSVRLKDESIPENWIFEVVPPQIKKIVLFSRNTADGIWQAWHAGYGNSLRTGWRNELFLAHRIGLEIAPQFFYVFVQAEDSFFNPLLLVPENSFFRGRDIETIWIAFAFGFAFALIAYNFLLLGTLKDRSYLWYSLQGLSLAVYFLLVRGVVFQYVDVDSSLIAPLTFAFLGLFLFFSTLFVRGFFANAPLPAWTKFLFNALSIVAVGIVPGAFILPVPLVTTGISVLNVVYPVVFLLLGGGALYKGYSPARFFLLAWMPLILATILVGMGGLGLVRSMEQMLVLLQGASLLEMLLLSLALADRIEGVRREKVVAAEMNTMRSAFFAAMRHAIFVPLEIIERETSRVSASALDPRQSKTVAIIRHSAGHLGQFVKDMLDMGAVEAGHLALSMERIDLQTFISDVVAVMQPLAEAKGLVLSVGGGDLPDSVVGDPVRLRQILLNLLGNGVKFTESGEVRLDVGMTENGMLRFSVIDSGPGISVGMLGTIFEPFAQTDSSMYRRHGGTGLGLPIAKRLVERMGGTIHVESVVGEGCTFSVIVPLAQENGLAVSAAKDVCTNGNTDCQ